MVGTIEKNEGTFLNAYEHYCILTIYPTLDIDCCDLFACNEVISNFLIDYSKDNPDFKYCLTYDSFGNGVVYYRGVMFGINCNDLQLKDSGYIDFTPYSKNIGHCCIFKLSDKEKVIHNIANDVPKTLGQC